MTRGELWWARPRLAGGNSKRRPVLVVSDDVFNRNERYDKVVVVHVTTVRRSGAPPDWEVELPRGGAGLDRSSIAKCAELYTLRKDQLESQIGTVPREALVKVDRALAIALSLRLSTIDVPGSEVTPRA